MFGDDCWLCSFIVGSVVSCLIVLCIYVYLWLGLRSFLFDVYLQFDGCDCYFVVFVCCGLLMWLWVVWCFVVCGAYCLVCLGVALV